MLFRKWYFGLTHFTILLYKACFKVSKDVMHWMNERMNEIGLTEHEQDNNHIVAVFFGDIFILYLYMGWLWYFSGPKLKNLHWDFLNYMMLISFKFFFMNLWYTY